MYLLSATGILSLTGIFLKTLVNTEVRKVNFNRFGANMKLAATHAAEDNEADCNFRRTGDMPDMAYSFFFFGV